MPNPVNSAIDTIRQRILFLEAAVGAPATTKPRIAGAITRLDAIADSVIAKQTWDPNSPEHGNVMGRPLSHADPRSF